jgi:hypothetical protein
MAVTSTPSITWLVAKLQARYPELSLTPSDDLAWSPSANTVYYSNDSNPSELLHEVGHSLLNHRRFDRDITLLGMERDAWLEARKVAENLHLTVDEEVSETHLDTYRDWLHARSTCPHCTETGIETAARIYNCLSCGASWHVNDARRCQLRRYLVK